MIGYVEEGPSSRFSRCKFKGIIIKLMLEVKGVFFLFLTSPTASGYSGGKKNKQGGERHIFLKKPWNF